MPALAYGIMIYDYKWLSIYLLISGPAGCVGRWPITCNLLHTQRGEGRNHRIFQRKIGALQTPKDHRVHRRHTTHFRGQGQQEIPSRMTVIDSPAWSLLLERVAETNVNFSNT